MHIESNTLVLPPKDEIPYMGQETLTLPEGTAKLRIEAGTSSTGTYDWKINCYNAQGSKIGRLYLNDEDR